MYRDPLAGPISTDHKSELRALKRAATSRSLVNRV